MIASGLCKAVLRLYSKEFRAEFAADIVASFTAHYREERRLGVGSLRIAAAQYRDIADLFRGALMDRFKRIMIVFHSRKRGSGTRIYMEEGFDGSMTGYKIVWRVYLAWQAREEAEWLQNMSSQGWEFVDYSWFVYYFRRREEPVEYEYKFERSFLLGWSARAEEAYLESMREQGWEFIKHFLVGIISAGPQLIKDVKPRRRRPWKSANTPKKAGYLVFWAWPPWQDSLRSASAA